MFIKKQLLILLVLVIFSAHMVNAIDECKGTLDQDEVPCMILLPANTTSTDCTLINVTVYNESVHIYNQSMTIYSPYFCNATFNQTNTGTYNFYYTTGDSGSIIIERGLRMIYLLYFAMAAIVGMFIVGLVKEDYTFVALSGIMTIIFGLYIYIHGFNGINNLIVDALSIIGILLGAYVFIGSAFEYTDLAKA